MASSRDKNWRAVAHMGHFAIYHRNQTAWLYQDRTPVMEWVEVQRVARVKPYKGTSTFAKLTDYTFLEQQSVIRAMERRVREFHNDKEAIKPSKYGIAGAMANAAAIRHARR